MDKIINTESKLKGENGIALINGFAQVEILRSQLDGNGKNS